jgi:anti-sigma regulatory factor (Ser/Thr protein kinase)
VWDRPDEIRAAHGEDPAQKRLFERLVRTESRFLLDNDLSLIPPLLGHLRDNLVRSHLCDEHGLIRLSIALSEALMNAIVHGNLEIDPCLRDADPRAFQILIEERPRAKPYRDRRVHVVAKELLHEARYVIRHEGPGFYVANPLAADGLRMFELVSVRSMVLIHTFMDEVSHDDTGTEVTLVKRRDP